MNGMQLSEDQKIVLLDMAYQCPYTHGEIVYAARALMTQYDYDLIYYRSLCEIDFNQRSFEKEERRNEKENLLMVYPNLAFDMVTFEFSDFSENNTLIVIEIFNVDGRKVLSETQTANQIINIPVDDLPGGVFSYVYTNATISFRGSIVILK